MTARFLIWALAAFLAFGALFFLAVVAVVLRSWKRQRDDAKRWALTPMRRLRR